MLQAQRSSEMSFEGWTMVAWRFVRRTLIFITNAMTVMVSTSGSTSGNTSRLARPASSSPSSTRTPLVRLSGSISNRALLLLLSTIFLVVIEHATYTLRPGKSPATSGPDELPSKQYQALKDNTKNSEKHQQQRQEDWRKENYQTNGNALNYNTQHSRNIGQVVAKPKSAKLTKPSSRRYYKAIANATFHHSSTNSTRHFYNSTGNATIPHHMFFTYSHDILANGTPAELYDNIHNTIQWYRHAWNDPQAPVTFLTDKSCRALLKIVAPDLLPHFDKEMDGSYKADICRVAALYRYGGYYLDVDLYVMEPIVLGDDIEFATVETNLKTMVGERNVTGLFFQAFLAAKRNSMVLKHAIKVMKKWYTEELPFNKEDLMGPTTLRYAYDTVPKTARSRVRLLQEGHLNDLEELYPDFPRQNGTGCCCDWVVHEPREEHVYFFSRVVTETGFKCSVEGQPQDEWYDEFGTAWDSIMMDDAVMIEGEDGNYQYEYRPSHETEEVPPPAGTGGKTAIEVYDEMSGRPAHKLESSD